MSRGFGAIQRRLQAALEAEPARRFTVAELVAQTYPGENVERAKFVSVRRALNALAIERAALARSAREGGAIRSR